MFQLKKIIFSWQDIDINDYNIYMETKVTCNIFITKSHRSEYDQKLQKYTQNPRFFVKKGNILKIYNKYKK